MSYLVDINDLNIIIVHELGCKKTDDPQKSFVSALFDTYDEAKEYANQKEIIYKFASKDCNTCNPGK